jgi:sulfur relay (sulfurtransferase) complex TusBCD TusD component (DsrE family)
MKTHRSLPLVGLAAAAALAAVPCTVTGDWTKNSGTETAGQPQDVVITLKVNALTNPETACLAVTLARALTSGATNVTLFVTLDGVALGDAKIVGNPKFKCTTPWGEISLEENLTAFLNDNDNNMVVCPICWMERYGDAMPDYGVLPGQGGTPGNAVGMVLLNAEKILDF